MIYCKQYNLKFWVILIISAMVVTVGCNSDQNSSGGTGSSPSPGSNSHSRNTIVNLDVPYVWDGGETEGSLYTSVVPAIESALNAELASDLIHVHLVPLSVFDPRSACYASLDVQNAAYSAFLADPNLSALFVFGHRSLSDSAEIGDFASYAQRIASSMRVSSDESVEAVNLAKLVFLPIRHGMPPHQDPGILSSMPMPPEPRDALPLPSYISLSVIRFTEESFHTLLNGPENQSAVLGIAIRIRAIVDLQ